MVLPPRRENINSPKRGGSIPLDRGDPLAVRRVLESDLNPLIGRGDLFVQLGQLLVKALEKRPARSERKTEIALAVSAPG